jgi:predicted nucleotidyltransferase
LPTAWVSTREIEQKTGKAVAGYTVILPSAHVRHVEKEHAYDGKGQRAATPQDYAHLLDSLNANDSLRPTAETGDNGQARFVVSKEINGEIFGAIWEIRPNKKNRAITLVTLSIKTS